MSPWNDEQRLALCIGHSAWLILQQCPVCVIDRVDPRHHNMVCLAGCSDTHVDMTEHRPLLLVQLLGHGSLAWVSKEVQECSCACWKISITAQAAASCV